MCKFYGAGQDRCRWNYCGGDWNFRTMNGFMRFYGIKEAKIIGKDVYSEDGKEIECFEYLGFATKQIERLKKHWIVEYCNPCRLINFKIIPIK